MTDRIDALSSTEIGVANIAWCPEHGLHGSRNRCFVCHRLVEQIAMFPLDDHNAEMLKSLREIERLREAAEALVEADSVLHRSAPADAWRRYTAAIVGLRAALAPAQEGSDG